MTLKHLDFVYMPSTDVAADMEYFTAVLGGRLIFAVEGMGTRVAMVELTDDPPHILLAGHLHGDQPVLVYRVDDRAVAMRELEDRGWQPEPTFEIPHGPVSSFRTPGGHRIAIYQLVRPEVGEHFAGRRDF